MGNELSQEEIFQLITQQKIAGLRKHINYQKAVAVSIQSITEDERHWIRKMLSSTSFEFMLKEDELIWLKQISEDYNLNYDAIVKLSPNYIRLKKVQFEKYSNKENVREKIDYLRSNLKEYTPEELIVLRTKKARQDMGLENFIGIYIIYNHVRNSYYVGKSGGVFSRAYKHFVTNPSKSEARSRTTSEYKLPELYNDYRSGDKFTISLIPLKETPFSILEELEAYAIAAYNASVEYGGYNRTEGNVHSKVCFNNYDHEKVANFIINKVKDTEIFTTLTNDKKRMKYTWTLALELALPRTPSFRLNFSKKIKEFHKDNKK
ncbi:excinuclease ABC subunit C [Sutcliffiella horikoshii]|uniref:Excinuclease ABC subunit C n=1 Tax=Sutcliffiella horikoshii TaxID=79883 RepID=A0AA94WLR6_9BACI|nr:excinuclease ABC subunit C [Sutcliffiella horikoshii]TYS57323.1 excinuclease ABC subunit C [Sutcliffiella horikoshii]